MLHFNVVVEWPKQIVDPVILQRSIRIDPSEDAEVLLAEAAGFRKALKKERFQISAKLESKVSVAIPFAVRQHMEQKKKCAWKDSTVRAL